MAGVFAGVGEAWFMAVGCTLAGSGIVKVSKLALKSARYFEKFEKDTADNAVWSQTASKIVRVAMLCMAAALAAAGIVLILGGSAVQLATCFGFDPFGLVLTAPVVAFGAYEYIGGTGVVSESVRDIAKAVFSPKPQLA